MGNKIIQKGGQYFSETEKHEMIKEYLSSGSTKREIWKKYTGQADHGTLIRWMRKLGYSVTSQRKNPVQTSTFATMSKPKAKSTQGYENFETLQLKKRISELEKQLKDAEMKAIAFSTMVDIAEEEFKIPIRKKLNTKP